MPLSEQEAGIRFRQIDHAVAEWDTIVRSELLRLGVPVLVVEEAVDKLRRELGTYWLSPLLYWQDERDEYASAYIESRYGIATPASSECEHALVEEPATS